MKLLCLKSCINNLYHQNSSALRPQVPELCFFLKFHPRGPDGFCLKCHRHRWKAVLKCHLAYFILFHGRRMSRAHGLRPHFWPRKWTKESSPIPPKILRCWSSHPIHPCQAVLWIFDWFRSHNVFNLVLWSILTYIYINGWVGFVVSDILKKKL